MLIDFFLKNGIIKSEEKMTYDKEKIKKLIERYEYLSNEEKESTEEKIRTSWQAMYDRFVELCDQDEVLTTAYDELEEAEKAMDFNWMDCYKRVWAVVNEHDPEFSDVLYEFDSDEYEKAKNYSENWEQIEKTHEAKINRLNSSKISLFRNKKIQKEMKEFEDKKSSVSVYRSYLEKERKKDFYLGKKEELKQLKDTLDSLTKCYAEQAASQFLKSNPEIACAIHIYYNPKNKRKYDLGLLKNIIEEVRYDVFFGNEDANEAE